jgi:hypothetical protein
VAGPAMERPQTLRAASRCRHLYSGLDIRTRSCFKSACNGEQTDQGYVGIGLRRPQTQFRPLNYGAKSFGIATQATLLTSVPEPDVVRGSVRPGGSLPEDIDGYARQGHNVCRYMSHHSDCAVGGTTRSTRRLDGKGDL